MSWHTFLSYSRQQYHFAESLALALQARGIAVWFDVQQLEPGTRWQQDIEDGLTNSGTVLLLASHAALESPYVAREWGSALQQGKPVIIALIERAPLPPALRRAPLIDCRGDFDSAVDRLLIALQNPAYPRRESTLLPRLSPGVARMGWALLLRDLQSILAAMLAFIMTVLLISQASLPRYLLADGRAALLRLLEPTELGDAVLPLLRPFLTAEWNASPIYAAITVIALTALALNLILVVTRLQMPRFLRRRFDYDVIIKLPHEFPRLLWVLWFALLSGYLSFVIDYFAPIAPTSLLTLALLFVILIFVSPNLYKWLQPKHPNADIVRWAKLGAVATYSRAGAMPGLAAAMLPRASGSAVVRFHAIAAPSDTDVLARLQPTVQQAGGQLVPTDQPADAALILLSHNASRTQVAAALSHYPRSVNILISRCNLPPEVDKLKDLQLIDYSRHDDDALYASLLLLTAQSDDQRARVQANLSPVSLKSTAPDGVIVNVSIALLALVILCVLTLGLLLLMGVNDPLGSVMFAITTLALIWAHERARRGRAAFPRWGMIVLVFLPLFLFALIALSQPSILALPQAWVFWLVLLFLQVGNFLLRWRRDMMSLLWQNRDPFGMNALPLQLGAAFSVLALSVVTSVALTYWLLDTGSG